LSGPRYPIFPRSIFIGNRRKDVENEAMCFAQDEIVNKSRICGSIKF
jgi:hypothetical protein